MTQNSNLLNFQNLIDRVIALCTKTVANSEGFSYWFVSNEHFPFFTARLGEIEPIFDDEDEEIVSYSFNIYVRHVTGNRTGGLPNIGEGEAMLYYQLPRVINALLSSQLFQSLPGFPDAPDWLESYDMLPCPGLQVFDASGIGGVGNQIGTTYTLACKARVQIDFEFE
jgi:hypothetical protein